MYGTPQIQHQDVLYVLTERQYPFEGQDPQTGVGNVLRTQSKG
jgi:hypothetical protein